jgi:hypothetical protein
MIEKSQIIHSGKADEVATEYIKLFNTPSQESNGIVGKNRWGDGRVKITSCKARVTEKDIKLDLVLTGYARSEEPVVGYLIKDADGHELFGSNTKLRKVNLGTLDKGDEVRVSWNIPNIFGDGMFFATIAVSQNDGITQHDWWENATTFRVFREDRTAYALNPISEIIVQKQ